MRPTMPSPVRRFLLAGALVAGMIPHAPATAQVADPCRPVPIPGLCPSSQPPPSLIPVPEDPSPAPKKERKRKGGRPRSTGPRRQPAPATTAPPRIAPFSVSGPNSTARLISLLSTLVPRGLPLEESILKVAGPFPVAGPAWWINDWHAPRSGGRVHKGLDIFAPAGTPLVAAASGVLSQKGVGGLCGIYVEITDAQGVQYFYCHMDAHAPGLVVGQAIEVGQVVGTVGNTGNAIHTPSHVHFEFQPGGVPQPPKPWVDRWVRIAEQRAADLVRSLGGSVETLVEEERFDAFRLTRTFDLGGSAQASGTERTTLIFPGMQPGLSALQVANGALGEMAWEIDWGAAGDAQLEELLNRYRTHLVTGSYSGLQPWPFEEPSAGGDPADGSD